MNIIPYIRDFKEYKERFDVRLLGKIECAPEISAESIIGELFFNKLPADGDLKIKVLYDAKIEPESYKMNILKQGIEISASDYNGALYAVQTLRVLTKIDTDCPEYLIGLAEISDSPRWGWRGLQLDESRHFFGESAVKRLLDIMSLNKLNVFHWHLTDDQGWRIEIKKYPLLTEIGSKRKKTGIHGWLKMDDDGTPHEGFYTQEQIKDIVAYASARGIKIIPEIDMPAHFAAAFASYSWLACRDKKVEVPWYFGGKYPIMHGIKDWNRSACIGKPSTFEFIYAVIDEITELFPAPYFHIGGDEAPKEEWKNCPDCQALMKKEGLETVEQLQGYFINKINEYVESKGRRLIGWNEVLEGGNLDNTVIAQYWVSKKDKNVLEHLKKGGSVLMSKHQSFYFDMPYAMRSLKNTYDFTPYFEGITSEYDKQILGVEGEVWTEWIPTVEKMDFQVFPRLQALAEVGWYGGEKDWNDFEKRLNAYLPILDAYKINYAEPEVYQPKCALKRAKEVRIWRFKNQDRELIKNNSLKQNKR